MYSKKLFIVHFTTQLKNLILLVALVTFGFKEFNPIQYGGGGGIMPPYSFSLISPERLELRPSKCLPIGYQKNTNMLF